MKFRTQIDIKPFDERIDYHSRILALGSCFADAIGGRLSRAKLNIEVNPVGVLFNAASISRTINRFKECRLISIDELSKGREGWFHYDFHSSLSSDDAELCVSQINRAIELGHKSLTQCDWVVITLGTSWVYELVDSGEIVANCHKQPSAMFRRKRLNISEIVDALESAFADIINTKRVIVTLSPVRHIADGLSENSLSKATLRVAIDEFVRRHPTQAYYFPSFEIFMDDLRDYRFYGEDMVHPSSVGVDYVWEHFTRVALSLECCEVMGRVLSVVRAAEHRASNPSSENYKRFCKDQLRIISTLPEGVDLETERQYFAKGAE